MKALKTAIRVVIAITLLLLTPGKLYAQPVVSAPSAILMEAESGEILLHKEAFQPMSPASTTKVLTAILALELAKPEEVVTVSKNAAATGEATIHLHAGEKLTVKQLVTGAMLKSGNDAAVALAEHVGGSVEFFSLLMNQKARLLGARSSNFVNPNGLPDKNHYSSAYDLAVITRYAFSNQLFADIVRKKVASIPWWNSGKRFLKNTNRLLWKYPGANGVKTGTTRAAGNCLIAAAKQNNMQLIAVVLKSNDRYGDCIRLFDYGFKNYAIEHIASGESWGKIRVVNGEKNWVEVKNDRPLTLVYPKNQAQLVERRLNVTRQVEASVKKGQQLGTLSLWLGNDKKRAVPLVAAEDIPARD